MQLGDEQTGVIGPVDLAELFDAFLAVHYRHCGYFSRDQGTVDSKGKERINAARKAAGEDEVPGEEPRVAPGKGWRKIRTHLVPSVEEYSVGVRKILTEPVLAFLPERLASRKEHRAPHAVDLGVKSVIACKLIEISDDLCGVIVLDRAHCLVVERRQGR